MDARSTPGPHGLLQIMPSVTWDPYLGSGISDRWHSLNTYSVSDTILYAVLLPNLPITNVATKHENLSTKNISTALGTTIQS